MMTEKEMMKMCNNYYSYDGTYKAKAIVKDVKDIMSKVNIDKENFKLVVVDTKEHYGKEIFKMELFNMSFSEMIEWDKKYANPRYEVVLMVWKPTYLDKVEENYLRNIITPFANSGCSNFSVEKASCENNMGKKGYYIRVGMENRFYSQNLSEFIALPTFDASQDMYRGLKTGKKYSIDYLVK